MFAWFGAGVKMDEGLRERKKRETRAAISRVATALFYERGFDAVTVDDVARAAGVSKMTVFNYFVRKEDLMLDREPEGIELLRSALDNRGQKSVLTALRDEVGRLVAAGNVFTKFDRRVLGFWKVVDDSPALRARLRELADEARETLAAHFEGPNADLVASLVVAGWHAAYRAGLDAARRGKSPQRAATELERVFDAAMAAARAAMRASSA
jgi:AcrR family transcriptional regulator